MAKRIGILTGGGDVPGLNTCIRAVVERAVDEGLEVLGIKRGWGGLLHVRLDDPASREENLQTLDRRAVRTVSRFGGTFLHTSRVNPGATREADLPGHLKGIYQVRADGKVDATVTVMKNLEALQLEALVTIGGDDTLSYTERLDSEGVPVVAIPKTMDNDVYGTDYCIGFSTAVTRSVNLINDLRTVAGSHERIMVVELFGRNSGETALITSWLADVDRTVITEVPFDPDRLTELLVQDKRRNPSGYAVCTISEGAVMEGGHIVEKGEPDAYGHRKLGGIGDITAKYIHKHSSDHIIYQQLAYLMRSGSPDSLDRMVARNFGNMALDLLLQNKSGHMVCLKDGRYDTVPLRTTRTGTKRVDVDNFYDREQYRARVSHVLGMPMFLY